MKTLILYYSRAGENYCSGRIVSLKKGNTETVVELLQEVTGADVFRIEQKTPYPENYAACTREAKKDRESNHCPELVSYLESLSDYGMIYLCYPNYWGGLPMAVVGQLRKLDFTGKRIRCVCTHEGSGMGISLAEVKRFCPGYSSLESLAVHGSEVNASGEIIRAFALK